MAGQSDSAIFLRNGNKTESCWARRSALSVWRTNLAVIPAGTHNYLLEIRHRGFTVRATCKAAYAPDYGDAKLRYDSRAQGAGVVRCCPGTEGTFLLQDRRGFNSIGGNECRV